MTATILENVKVLDLTRVLAGPWSTQALADMGATVYKIERIGVGDEMRHSPPFLTDLDGVRTNDTTSYVCVNRGKKSITVDFTQPQGQALLLDLARQCDVLVENFKVGDLRRYGLDYESVKKVNPSIVYCSVTGYGQDGPMAHLPGYDPVFQAITGFMSTCGIADGDPGAGPMRSMIPVVDVMTGMVATSAVLAALYHKLATGEGQQVDVALLDVAIAATVHLSQNYLSTGKLPKRAGNSSLLFAPAGCFPCRDGEIFIQIGNDGQWVRFAKAIGKHGWLSDERFGTNSARMRHGEELRNAVADITSGWEKQKLADLLSESGVPVGPVNDLAQAFEHPQVRHRQLKVDVDHPVLGTLPLVRSPFRFSKTPVQFKAPPSMGADTQNVLRNELGLGDAEISELQQASVI